jgi:hypothetical protein
MEGAKDNPQCPLASALLISSSPTMATDLWQSRIKNRPPHSAHMAWCWGLSIGGAPAQKCVHKRQTHASETRAHRRASVTATIQLCSLTIRPSSKSCRVRSRRRARSSTVFTSRSPVEFWGKSTHSRRASVCTSASCGASRRYSWPIILALAVCLRIWPNPEPRVFSIHGVARVDHGWHGRASTKRPTQRVVVKNRRRSLRVSRPISFFPSGDLPAVRQEQ